MRDAFGGVFTMNLLLVFIFIYVAFTAVSLNYAKAFRVKNSVIDFIEQSEIKDLDDYFGKSMATKDKTKLDNILTDASYNKTCTTNDEITTTEGTGYCYNGIIILKDREEKIEGTDSKIVYYKVKTYADWNLGALNKLLALAGKGEDSDTIVNGTWVINGEAKVVVKN